MARFATGVTVVTTRGDGGRWHAMTANSFTSVSLDPPLVLLSVATSTRFHRPLTESGDFAVSVLSADQAAVAAHFARSGRDLASQFDGVAHRVGQLGLPLLTGALAWLECRTVERVAAGDHTLFVASVLTAEPADAAADLAPLLFYGSRYLGAENA
nr:flavin reductase family protein [Naumannella cuiyingiana]